MREFQWFSESFGSTQIGQNSDSVESGVFPQPESIIGQLIESVALAGKHLKIFRIVETSSVLASRLEGLLDLHSVPYLTYVAGESVSVVIDLDQRLSKIPQDYAHWCIPDRSLTVVSGISAQRVFKRYEEVFFGLRSLEHCQLGKDHLVAAHREDTDRDVVSGLCTESAFRAIPENVRGELIWICDGGGSVKV